MHDNHFIGFDAAGFDVQQRGEGEACDGIDVAANQHGFTQWGVHGRPSHIANVVGFLEDGESTATCVKYGCAQFLACQIGWRFDARFFERHDRCWRVVVDHHDGHRFVGYFGVVGVEFHQGCQVCKTNVVTARRYAGDRGARTIACVNRDVELGIFEIALGNRREEQGRRAFKTPVELKFNGSVLSLCQAKSASR